MLVTRVNLYNLPYSVDEVYEIKTSGKYVGMERTYSTFRPFYGIPRLLSDSMSADVVLTEDAKSGFQFFSRVAKETGVECVSARGKSKVLKALKNLEGKRVAAIVDGAAFGPEMDLVCKLRSLRGGDVTLFAPESFEWLLLKSGILRDPEVRKVLDRTALGINLAI